MNFKLFEALTAFNNLSTKDLGILKRLTDLNEPGIKFGITYQGHSIHYEFNPLPEDNYIIIDTSNQTIRLPEGYEYNPYWVALIDKLNLTGIFNDYSAIANKQTTSFRSIISSIKNVSGKYNTWAMEKYDHKSALKRFGVKVIKEIWERQWYHATFKKYISNIKNTGLQPSKTLGDIMREKGVASISLGDLPQFGWSSGYNPDKQAAVYLFSSSKQANELAEYLSYRNREAAVVLEIDGRAIKDYSKLVLDEDYMRDFDGIMNKRLKLQIPHFYHSFINMGSIGYKGVIPAQYVKVIKEYS